MRPSLVLEANRALIRATVARHRASNPRMFGSTAAQRDTESSDLDLLVDPLPGATLFDLGGLQLELETALGVSVDLRTPGDLPARWRAAVLEQALAV